MIVNNKARAFVVLTCVVAALSGWGMYAFGPSMRPDAGSSLAVLSILAIIAEMLALALPRAAEGSVAFIAYLAMTLLVPSWESIATVAVVKAAVEVALVRRDAIKKLFNVANHVVAQTLAATTYIVLNGQSFLDFRSRGMADLTVSVGLASTAACFVGLATNAALLSVTIALSNRTSAGRVFRENHGAIIVLDLLCATLVFVFAWVYVSLGWMAAVALWVPILGIRQVHKTNLDLERTNQELLQLMVKSIEARDPYTSGHSKRVQQYSIAIARSLGLREREVERIGTAALLHDVGKIYEKYGPILSNPGKLSAEEWLTMKEHPADGAQLVATMSGLADIVPAIRHHHENWDGTGYPDGLAGDQIPLTSRVITFADTIDAMTSERPYRPSLTEEDVRAEIVKCRGKQFDPTLADHVLSARTWTLLFGHLGSPPRSAKPSLVISGTRTRTSA